jgi:serine/threonine protein kinase
LGIARDVTSKTKVGNTFAGTDYYMSPEIVNNEQYTSKTDIWSFGCVVYEMIMLKKPFDGNNQLEIFTSILKQAPEMPKNLQHELTVILNRLFIFEIFSCVIFQAFYHLIFLIAV